MSEYLKDLEKYSKPEAVKAQPDGAKEKKFAPKPDPIYLKLHPDPHPLSSEEQLLFVRITEATFGYNEQIRNETLQVLAHSYNVRFLAPYLCKFVTEAIHVNLAFPDLSLLIYSVRMVKGLMVNPHIDLKPHLHLVLPATLSCILSKKISKYNYDNHWTLRDFSAQVVAAMCHNYNNRVNDITRRVVKVYVGALQDQRRPLTSLYGGVKGLGCLGDDYVKAYVIPHISTLSWRICNILERARYLNDNNIETKQAKYVSDVIVSVTGPILLKHRNTDDGGVSYIKDFGYLGYSLYNHVKNLEKAQIDEKNNFNVYLFCAQ